VKSLLREDNRDLALTGKQQEGATLDGSREPVEEGLRIQITWQPKLSVRNVLAEHF